ncbi:M48 family metalloprotease [Stella sp.]|uniref:M48 family metalloprotease n=1 Tax=Stella sp. TaxID=2912054 RepID=UPI0035B38091
MSRSLVRRLLAGLIACLLAVEPAVAQNRVSLIRDAEIEATIRAYAAPLFAVAGLDPDAVQVYLVNDTRINAFVAGGQRLFLNTGLIMRARNPNQLSGVIAHETGHIAGGHLARLQDALSTATTAAIVSMLLGIAAAALAGDGKAAGAAIVGGTSLAERNLLYYNRGQESAADQAGMSYLDRTGQSSRGMLEFFELLENQELLTAVRQDPYLRSHPLTRERIDAVRAHVARSRHSDAGDSPELMARHARMIAKLRGFLLPPSQTLRQYPDTDRSLPARYARAIAHYRVPDLPRARAGIDALIAEFPADPWFHELKGQVLFENGRVAEAEAPYREALRLAPGEPLLRYGLAQVLLEYNTVPAATEARALLNEAVRHETRNPSFWRLLAIAYGREGNIGMAALSLSEQAAAAGNHRTALQQATRALGVLPRGSPGWLRAEDLRDEARRGIKRDRDAGRDRRDDD